MNRSSSPGLRVLKKKKKSHSLDQVASEFSSSLKNSEDQENNSYSDVNGWYHLVVVLAFKDDP